jgi:DNA-binding NarL/FixJ family response regulator
VWREDSSGKEKHVVTRILIVDDNENVRRFLKMFLLNADPSFSVCGEAGDGKEALLKADELKPDVVILDLVMPVMDGVTAAREISKTHKGMVMFMYTLHNTYQLELEARKAGIRKIVAKSAPTELVSLIRGINSSPCHQR